MTEKKPKAADPQSLLTDMLGAAPYNNTMSDIAIAMVASLERGRPSLWRQLKQQAGRARIWTKAALVRCGSEH